MRTLLLAASAALALALPATAQDEPKGAPAPSEIVAAAPKADWVAIPAEDLLVMTLAPDADGSPRTVVIQLMPAPFSQGWVHNIRLFARAGWYDGNSVNRVQDNYVTQWGDPNYDNPESTGQAKPLPEGLKVMGEADYVTTDLLALPDQRGRPRINYGLAASMTRNAMIAANGRVVVPRAFAEALQSGKRPENIETAEMGDAYAHFVTVALGWPIAGTAGTIGKDGKAFWPTHCYGMVGVGRNYSPDTGSGAELYTVIGHAPRHLDRNIALVGRVIEGMQHLSSLQRGSGALGFYTAEEAAKRTPILSVRVASDLPAGEHTPRPSPIAAIRSSSSPLAARISATSACRCGGRPPPNNHHCERSAAIQSGSRHALDCRVAALLAMTVVPTADPPAPPRRSRARRRGCG